jgi:hypothetical protein
MVDIKQVETLLKKHFFVDGVANIDPVTGNVDIKGTIELRPIKIKKLPITFGRVSGDCMLYNNSLVSLKGAPHQVDGAFYCTSNKLTSLMGAPNHVGGNFDCGHNQLTSLVGAPTHVGGSVWARGNPFSSLEGMPAKLGYSIVIDYNSHVPLLRLLTSPFFGIESNNPFDDATQHIIASTAHRVLQKRAGAGRRGAITAARELLSEGEKIQQEQGLARNPFEANARW